MRRKIICSKEKSFVLPFDIVIDNISFLINGKERKKTDKNKCLDRKTILSFFS